MAKNEKSKSVGAPPWMVTFADLMALLLTMFVLLLSFSEMDIKKYKQIAGEMQDAFGLQSIMRMAGMVELEGSPSREQVSRHRPSPEVMIKLPDIIGETQTEDPGKISQTEELKKLLADEIRRSGIDVLEKDETTVIRFPEKIAFAPGSANLESKFLAVLEKVIPVLIATQGEIIVAGHTDNRPIRTARFRSNWDLSTARAVSVIHHILDKTGLPSSRVRAEGYADSRPLAPNDTAENRAINRRVEMTIGNMP